VYIRAGSIVPMVGQTQQYVGENRDAQVILFVYAAANGHFSLYEDDGHTYGYERGEFSSIPIDWNEATRTLTIGARTGTYPGIPRTRSFFVELVTPQNPIGYATQATGVTVTYTGTMVRTRMP
jgi:alpha-D-xyloside xylohydrolase